MSIQVTRTKVIVPRRRSDLLSRKRLLDLLYDLLEHKLVIFAAPAGYGKTSLLVDFARQADLRVCWYALDSLDRDLLRFVAHFIAAIGQGFPSFGRQSESTLNAMAQSKLDVDRLVPAIINDVYENIREYFVLVLDDYHLVNDNKEINNFISRFIQDVGENCHLILASRSLLTIPDMPLMVARSQVGGLSFEELAFQPEEIQSLILQNYHVTMPDTVAEELVRETEGWITGLLLSAQSMWQGMADRLRLARVSGVGLYDYLAQQVLEQQSPEVQDFLVRTAFLEEFDADLCAAVFGPGVDWAQMIETVLHNNLFVLPVGEDGRWLRYHHLFRDFLQARLEQDCPQEKDRLLRRLAEVYAERDEWERAYAISQRLGDENAIASVIEQAGPALVKSGRMVILTEWIDDLPAEALATRPNLLSLRGVAAVTQGQIEKGLDLLNLAEAELRSRGDLSGLARTLVRKADAHRFLGNYQASLEEAAEALVLSGQNGDRLQVQAGALRTIAMNLYSTGQLQAASDRLVQSLEAYQSAGDRQMGAMVLMELGMVYRNIGDYERALEHYQQALDYWNEKHNSLGQATLLNNLGVLYHLLGDYTRACSLFNDALILAKDLKNAHLEAYVFCSTGDLYGDLEAVEPAREAYRQAREIARQIDSRSLLHYLDLAEADLWRRSQDFQNSRRLIDAAGRKNRPGRSGYEEGLWQFSSGRLSLSEGNPALAIEHLKEALARFDQGGHRVEAARAYLFLSAAFHANKNLPESFTALKMAFQKADNLDNEQSLVVAGREAKDLLAACQQDPATGHLASRLLDQVNRFEADIPSIRRNLRPHTAAIPFSPPKLTVQALGGGRIKLDGEPVTAPEWQNQRRVREFFFCLLANPEGVSREELGAIFWPDSSAAQLKLQFKNVLYRLRYVIGQEAILFDGDRYWFNQALDYEYDVLVFLDKLAQARESDHPERKKSAYRAAVDLYKGPYLKGMDGTWIGPERERLRLLYSEAMLNLAQLSLESGEYSQALEYCENILGEDACMEEAHRLAMRAYAAKGNRAAVTRQFERCCLALRKEVGAEPSSQTESLYEILLK